MRVLLGSLFRLLYLLFVTFMSSNLFCVSKSNIKHQQKPDLLSVSYAYEKCMFVNPLIEYIDPPNCAHY